MKKKEIYAPLSEDGLLKSLGPFRIFVSDKTTEGSFQSEEIIYGSALQDVTLIYGQEKLVEKQSKLFNQ